MGRRLPPLNAVRAFEAAARHLSFTRAADELNVTQAAISHQVKALEERLGVRLFRRLNRALELTRAGETYLPRVTAALDALAEATDAIRAAEDGRQLTVSVLPSFAAKWLMPRLRSLWRSHPDLDVKIVASDALADFDVDGTDVAIRYGSGQGAGLRADLLFHEELFPVCSPALLDGPIPLACPADLCRHTLLHELMEVDWMTWLKAAGVTGVPVRRGPVFSHSSMVLDAAASGLGVALGRSALVNDDLTAGRLVRPFALSVPARAAYFLMCPEESSSLPKVATFRAWLLKEARGEMAAAGIASHG